MLVSYLIFPSLFKVPADLNLQKQFVALFVPDDAPAMFDYKKCLEFMKECVKKVKTKKEQQENKKEKEAEKSDGLLYGVEDNQESSRGRKSSLRGEIAKEKFADRRDAGLLLQLEQSFQSCTSDPYVLIHHLENTLRTTCRSDENLVENNHVSVGGG